MQRARGFTLVEVLVAMAVLAIGLGAITVTMTRYTQTANLLRERALALVVAHNRLTEVELQPVWPEVGKSDGEMEMADRYWRWDVLVSETSDEMLRRINIQVRPLRGKGASPDKDAQVLAELNGFISDSGRSDE